jgi:hypothetical protein
MADSERSRMLELGQWLQGYLAPDADVKAYWKLAKDFLRIYNVDFKLSRNDIGLQIFELMDKTGTNEKSVIQSIEVLNELVDNIPEGQRLSFKGLGKEDPIAEAICQVCTKNGTYSPDFDFIGDSYMIRVMVILETFANILEVRHHLTSFFWEIIGGNVNWEHHFSEKIRTRGNLSDIEPGTKLEGNGWNLTATLAAYNSCLSDEISHERGKFKKIKVFRDKALPPAPVFEKDLSFFPWKEAAARVFFDFLFAGGQDHFKFCDYCGGFTVIRRKGSKKFCSDRCRAHHRLDEIAKSQ